METRKVQLQLITDFIDDADTKVDQMLANYSWSRSELNRKQTHKAQQKSAAPDPDVFPESFYDEHNPFTVKFDKNVQANVIREAQSTFAIDSDMSVERELPLNHKDLLVNFSPAERLALNQFVLQNTPAIPLLEEKQISFKKQNKDAKMTSLADIATYRRNVFRRNQKYRVAKNPLTYQEEVHNLIQMQTEAMVEYLEQVKSKAKSRREEDDRDRRTRDKHDKERSRGKSYEGSYRKRSKYD